MQIKKDLVREVTKILIRIIGDHHPCPRCGAAVETNRLLRQEAKKVWKQLEEKL